ncbi:hypothetical protein GW17_00042549 [Ensete ventricosum]|nr:hypothetical protein GW17_00042549 [Ensete ventricosum]
MQLSASSGTGLYHNAVVSSSNNPRSRTIAATLSNRALLCHRNRLHPAVAASPSCDRSSPFLRNRSYRSTSQAATSVSQQNRASLPHLSPALFSFEDMKIWVLLYTDVHIAVTTWSPLLFGANTPLHPRPLPLSPLPSPRARLPPPLVDHYRSPRRPLSQPSTATIAAFSFSPHQILLLFVGQLSAVHNQRHRSLRSKISRFCNQAFLLCPFFPCHLRLPPIAPYH